MTPRPANLRVVADAARAGRTYTKPVLRRLGLLRRLTRFTF